MLFQYCLSSPWSLICDYNSFAWLRSDSTRGKTIACVVSAVVDLTIKYVCVCGIDPQKYKQRHNLHKDAMHKPSLCVYVCERIAIFGTNMHDSQ